MVKQISDTDNGKSGDKFLAYISRSTSTGKVNLKFTAKLNSGFTKLKSNFKQVEFSEIFNVSLIPDDTNYGDESEDEMIRDLEKLGFSWEVTSI